MSPTRVGVIGAGLAGLSLALFLKMKGYDPEVFERTQGDLESGLSIGLQYNGQSVLAKIPGLLEYIGAFQIDEIYMYSVVEGDEGLLGISDHPKRLREGGNFGMISTGRSAFQRKLTEFAQKMGVHINWGYQLQSFEQSDDSVQVLFTNGVKDTFSFIIGCDGLHSNIRKQLFGSQPARYTGVTQLGGVSPKPESWGGKPMAAEAYGDGSHVVVTPISDKTVAWAVTQVEPEAKESWRSLDESKAQEVRKMLPYSEWGYGVGEAIRNSLRVVKYGVYDRPDLERWHEKRVVMIGDAAHPTSPHIGQGANQAFEDVGLLIELLEKHNPSAGAPSTAVLETVYTELEKVRMPRAYEMVQRARDQGKTRVAAGRDACIARNNFYREAYKSGTLQKARFGV